MIARCDRPVLMVAGDRSQFWPPEHATVSAASAPQGRAAVIEDAGHAVNFDQPDAFNARLLEFLSSL